MVVVVGCLLTIVLPYCSFFFNKCISYSATRNFMFKCV
uniref:Uncharacterized protein n=1 Tax=Anguilla anguilla TaxID=7936 RepID=A0A0E9W5N0_ANGAN